MTKAQLLTHLAYLEFENDQLESELSEVDFLLTSIGFPHGLESAKEVAMEFLEEQNGQI